VIDQKIEALSERFSLSVDCQAAIAALLNELDPAPRAAPDEAPALPADTPSDADLPTDLDPRAEAPALPADAPSDAPAVTDLRDPADDAPDLPPRYRDQGLLGVGGMGEVRRVHDRQLRRSVALKILHAELTGEEAEVRFLEEAQVTAQLQHPGVIPVYDVGRLPDGRRYFTMKEVQGRTLRDAIREVHAASAGGRWRPTSAAEGGRPWTFRRLIEAFRRVCEAVGYAHERGIIHRDLKPQNVMVGELGQVLVIDWGLAKLGGQETAAGGARQVVSDRAEGDAFASRADQVQGTLLYMAPEQAMGRVDRMGPPASTSPPWPRTRT
jgi:serine/threonine-protein kinase